MMKSKDGLIHPDLIDCLVPDSFQEGVHFMKRENGPFPRGFTWVSSGDLVIIRRSNGDLKFGEIMSQVGPLWQNSFLICVGVNATHAGQDPDRADGFVPSCTRTELGSNILFITPLGFKTLGGRRTAAVAKGGIIPPLPGMAPPSPPPHVRGSENLTTPSSGYDDTDGYYNKVVQI